MTIYKLYLVQKWGTPWHPTMYHHFLVRFRFWAIAHFCNTPYFIYHHLPAKVLTLAPPCAVSLASFWDDATSTSHPHVQWLPLDKACGTKASQRFGGIQIHGDISPYHT